MRVEVRNSALHYRDYDSGLIDRPSTCRCPTDTSLLVRVKGRFVIDRDFFARFDVAQGDEQNVFVSNLHEGIRFARVVDIVSAISSATSIQTPSIIDRANSQRLTMSPTIGFSVGYFLAGVFGNFAAAGKRLGCKTTLTVDARWSDGKPLGEFHFHDQMGLEFSITDDLLMVKRKAATLFSAARDP